MQEYNEEDIQKKVEEEIMKWNKNNKKPNILICGQTGAGKTSVVKYLFKDKAVNAMVGNSGQPCTKDIQFYEGDNLNIYDSEGYEIGAEKQTHYHQLLIENFLEKKTNIQEDGIQVVWYTINGKAKRVTDLDNALINEIQALGYKTAVLITQIDELNEQQMNEIKEALKSVQAPVFCTSIYTDIPEVATVCDWKELTDWTINILPQIFQNKYINALAGDLERKHKQAEKYIWTATLGAAGVGAAPIPGADAPILIAGQSILICSILSLYNIETSKSAVGAILSNVGIHNLGKLLASSLLKLLPGFGNTANALVAATLTYALGETLRQLCHKQAEQLLKGEEVTIDIEKIMTSKEFQNKVMCNYEIFKDLIKDKIAAAIKK